MEWKPIETIPINTVVLLLDSERTVRMGKCPFSRPLAGDSLTFKSDMDLGDFDASAWWPKDLTATHWMPLPEPPPAQEKADDQAE